MKHEKIQKEESEEEIQENTFQMEELDDIELDPLEIQAYNNLLKAKQKIELSNMSEDEKKKVAKAILRSAEKVNKEDLILEKLEEIKLHELWGQTLHISSKTKINIENYEDDINRELEFYNQALESSYSAWDKMRKHEMPLIRPDDYFAEMVKSDAQMSKIKEGLLRTKEGIEKKDDNRKRKEQRKYGKKIQEEKLKEKIEKKKQSIEAIKSWKKSQKGKENYDIDVLEDNIKQMSENNINDAHSFERFQKNKSNRSQGKSKGISKKKGKAPPKKRLGKSKRINWKSNTK